MKAAGESRQGAVEGITKSNRSLVFVAMVVAFWGAGAWQMADNKRAASEDEIAEVEEEGDCEAKYVRAWSSAGGAPDGKSESRLKRSDLQNIRGFCLRERKLEEMRSERE